MSELLPHLFTSHLFSDIFHAFTDGIGHSEIMKISKLEVLWITEPTAMVSRLCITYITRDLFSPLLKSNMAKVYLALEDLSYSK
ncbi:hypothetical protein H0H92_006244, partial [Tricholoma furcatifolium]